MPTLQAMLFFQYRQVQQAQKPSMQNGRLEHMRLPLIYNKEQEVHKLFLLLLVLKCLQSQLLHEKDICLMDIMTKLEARAPSIMMKQEKTSKTGIKDLQHCMHTGFHMRIVYSSRII